MTDTDKPFPWGCTCGEETVMPDGPSLTCRKCGQEWANPYYGHEPLQGPYKTSETIRRHIEEAENKRDSLPDHDIQSWHFFNGKVIALQDLLKELVTGVL